MSKLTRYSLKLIVIGLPYLALGTLFISPEIYLDTRIRLKELKADLQLRGKQSQRRQAERILAHLHSTTPSLGPADLRHFVHVHSVHQVDEAHASYAWNTPLVLERLLASSQGKGKPPHLSCGPRAQALKALYDAAALDSRLVHLYSDTAEQVLSHSLVELRSARSGSWELQDPDFDISYRDPATGRPLSAMSLLFPGDRTAEAIAYDGTIVPLPPGLEDYFKAVKIDGVHSATVVVNHLRFDTTKLFPANGNIRFEDFCHLHYAPCHVLSP